MKVESLIKLSELPDTPWRWIVITVAIAIIATGSWALDMTPIIGGPLWQAKEASLQNKIQIDVLIIEVAGVQSSIVCSGLRSGIEKNRADLYAIEREIEMADGNVTERVLERRTQLLNTLRDNEVTFRTLGCITVLA